MSAHSRLVRLAAEMLHFAGSYPPGRGGYSVWLEYRHDPGDVEDPSAATEEQEKHRFRTLDDFVRWLTAHGYHLHGKMKYQDKLPGWKIPGWYHQSDSGYHFDPRWGDLDHPMDITQIGIMKDNKEPLTPDEIQFVERELARQEKRDMSRKGRLKAILASEGLTKRAAAIQVGDIFDSNWGYEQTNIDFYEVVGMTKTQVMLRRLEKKVVRSNPPSEYVVPVLGRYTSAPMRRKIKEGWRGEPWITINTYAGASPWDGQPKAQTMSAYGH